MDSEPLEADIEEVEEEESFTPEESKRFIELIQVGKVTREIEVLDHYIVIKSMDVGEELALGLMLKEFDSSPAYTRAYKAAVVAAVVVSIDGKPFYQSLGPESFSVALRARFDKIKNYHPSVNDLIYAEYIKMEQEEIAPILSRLGKI